MAFDIHVCVWVCCLLCEKGLMPDTMSMVIKEVPTRICLPCTLAAMPCLSVAVIIVSREIMLWSLQLLQLWLNRTFLIMWQCREVGWPKISVARPFVGMHVSAGRWTPSSQMTIQMFCRRLLHASKVLNGQWLWMRPFHKNLKCCNPCMGDSIKYILFKNWDNLGNILLTSFFMVCENKRTSMGPHLFKLRSLKFRENIHSLEFRELLSFFSPDFLNWKHYLPEKSFIKILFYIAQECWLQEIRKRNLRFKS